MQWSGGLCFKHGNSFQISVWCLHYRVVFADRNAKPVQMAASKSTIPNIISCGLAMPNSTEAAKKTMTVERAYAVHLKKSVISFRAAWV
jgi:hypothetical protein